ncbi:hypothetical protein [Herbaspirillum sp. B65]|uniref:hypothetical protein n=1 Tax=Herbaspirillum sp. B65 TaxID=137708 RepID=UPI0011D28329|nr:hypothetical protein [Herbaspirillum sp. B65]
MYLNIILPENLGTKLMLELRHIPCFCKKGGGKFELSFLDPLPEATGLIHGWDSDKVDQRAPAGAGGIYTHYGFATVTLKKIDREKYKIIDLSLFKTSYPGWFPIFKDGDWAEPVSVNTPEEMAEIERLDALYPPVKLTKKMRRRLPPDSVE